MNTTTEKPHILSIQCEDDAAESSNHQQAAIASARLIAEMETRDWPYEAVIDHAMHALAMLVRRKHRQLAMALEKMSCHHHAMYVCLKGEPSPPMTELVQGFGECVANEIQKLTEE